MKRAQRAGVIRQPIVAVMTAQDAGVRRLASRSCLYAATVIPSTPALASRFCRQNARSSAAMSTWCSWAVNRVWAACRAAAFTRARLGGRAVRLCVRTLASTREIPPGWSLPSARLVSFDGFIGTMNQSELPTSARMMAPAVPCQHPPPETNPADPVGPLRFQRWPSVHDAAHDPGGATPSRLTMAHMLPSLDATSSASATLNLSRLNTNALHGSCLRFGPRVTATPAKLGSGLPATALAG